MQLNPDICYQALLTHDRRFDGVFFVGVKTTGIYCRTVCPAKTPQLKSCTFFSNAALAEKDGFRPCLRCRPELAPGNGIMDSVPRLAAIAANRIEDGALRDGTLDDLANDMGISSRHLRRVIEKEFGVSPIELAQTQRLLYAKRLLADTKIPITEIAFASGFSSVRRFNTLLKERYGLNPTDIRKSTGRLRTETADGTNMSFIEPNILRCEIHYTPPFDWKKTLAFLKARSTAGIEMVDEEKYFRTASFGKHSGWLIVEPSENENSLSVSISESLAPAFPSVVARVKRLFDTFADPKVIADCLGDLAQTTPGIRVPGSFDGFEMALRAILGQQVSVAAATTLAGRVAAKFGAHIETPFEKLRLITPNAEKLAKAEVSEVTTLGITTSRAETLLTLARAVANGELSLEPGADVERTIEKLVSMKGIGEWTAHYIAMRALSWPDAFPHADLGIRKAMNMTSKSELILASEKWRPWRSYAVMQLWNSLPATTPIAKENPAARKTRLAKTVSNKKPKTKV
ncbi:DNA-3-methyladenine glycosylase 2 [Candidatus Obscuribacterales bacterium]|nr:DNA-3-methyladenine glycosylase 2 [Candidatus Obscuribacterales bacterium]